jgi:hypothetical protein
MATMLVEAHLMQTSPFAALSRVSTVALLIAVPCLLVQAQAPSPSPIPQAATRQSRTAASLNDILLAKATGLYDSTAKSGLRSFDCQVHPDWNKMMASSRKNASEAADEAKVALLGTVKIILHARLNGGSALDWQVPEPAEKPLDQAQTSAIEKAHKGVEKTLDGFLKLWTPLVDGSVAESLGEDGMNLAQTANGYTLRSKDKRYPRIEEFDRDLLLKHFIVADSASTVDIAPIFRPSARGLLVQSFVARIQPQGAPPEAAQEMHIGLEYQTVSATQIPARISVEVPNVVEMDFALDGCTVNRESN